MSLSLRKSLQLNQDVCTGPGKLVVYAMKKGQQEDSYAALVHQEEVELLTLDGEVNILQRESLKLDNLKADSANDVQVVWCNPETDTDEPILVLTYTDQLLRVCYDRSIGQWKANLNSGKQRGWTSALAAVDRYIYRGSSEGLWEMSSKDLKPSAQLSQLSITAACVSEDFLAAGHETGGITLFRGGFNNWTEMHRMDGPQQRTCCTALLQDIAEQVLVSSYSNGSVRLHSLPDLNLLSHTPAHVRSIVQLMPVKDGAFVSAAEDGFLHLWKVAAIGRGDASQEKGIRYVDSFQMQDGMITGGSTVRDDDEGATGLLITVYDRPLLHLVMVDHKPIIPNSLLHNLQN